MAWQRSYQKELWGWTIGLTIQLPFEVISRKTKVTLDGSIQDHTGIPLWFHWAVECERGNIQGEWSTCQTLSRRWAFSGASSNAAWAPTCSQWITRNGQANDLKRALVWRQPNSGMFLCIFTYIFFFIYLTYFHIACLYKFDRYQLKNTLLDQPSKVGSGRAKSRHQTVEQGSCSTCRAALL